MAKKCQCRGRIRTNIDGTCVSSGDMCKSCIATEQARIDAKKVVDQTVESGLSVDSKVEVKPICAPPAEVKPIGAPPSDVVPFTSEDQPKQPTPLEASKVFGTFKGVTTSDEKGPKKA